MTGSGVRPENAETPAVLTVDIGTSSTRCIVYDARGRAVEGWESHRPYEVDTTPDGGVTLDADFALGLTSQCIDDVLRALGRRADEIAAVACDTFWHSMLGVDEAGRPVTPVLTWADMRAVDAAGELRRRLDPKAIHETTGAEIHPSYLPAKLVWLHRAMPEVFARARYWMSLGEYFYLRLFHERMVSISMASGTGLLDQHRCVYDGAMLDALPLREDQLSPIRDFSQPAGGLGDDCATRWPALRYVPWYLPIGDGAANNVGSGGFTGRDVVVMIGTSGALRVVREATDFKVPPGLWSYRVDARRIVQGGALSSGGNVWSWITSTLHIGDLETFEGRVGDLAPDSHGLTVLPFLAGERSPHWNPHARSALVGATLGTTDAQIVRAFLEATSYEFGLVFDRLREVVPEVRGIIGSGSGLIHSPAWMQIMTDVLGAPVTTSAAKEATSRGAALLALQAMGEIRALSDVPVPLGRTYRPDPACHQTYRGAMERQQALYQLLIPRESGTEDHGSADR